MYYTDSLLLVKPNPCRREKNNRSEMFIASERNVTIESDERLHFTGHGYLTVQFEDNPLYKSGVSDLYVTMEYHLKIDEVDFHIAVRN